ncbi:MAG: HAD hydrolase-like protein, partial [Minisyncoccales bacterium]
NGLTEKVESEARITFDGSMHLLGDCLKHTQEPAYRRKPDPEGINVLIEKLCVPGEKVLYVGKGPKDQELASNANVRFIGLNRTSPDDSEIKDLYQLISKYL